MKLRDSIEERYGERFEHARHAATRRYYRGRLAFERRRGSQAKGVPRVAVPIAGMVGAAGAWAMAHKNGHQNDAETEAQTEMSTATGVANGEVGDLKVGGEAVR